jgi:hypothetical protein
MAQFKYDVYFSKNQHAAFDAVISPGTVINNSGIYRCEGCASEIAANKGDPLPPQNHHQHSSAQGKIRWRLIACTG